VLGGFALGASGTPRARACSVPPYTRGLGEITSDSVDLSIGLGPGDFDPSTLSCLARDFRRRYPRQHSILLRIFSSAEAARKWFPTGIEAPEKDWGGHQHASYSFDAATHREMLKLLPFGLYDEATLETSLDVEGTKGWPCSIKFAGRCLLISEPLLWPRDAEGSLLFGAATVEATVTRAGTVRLVAAGERLGGLRSGDDHIREVVTEVVRTWRLERSSREDHIQVGFRYEVGEIAPNDHWFRFEQPNTFVFRAPSRAKRH
jgi:hypothetical protein